MMIDNQDFVVSQTDDITISACPMLVEENMSSQTKEFVWGYYLCIENNSNEKIHLIGKNWNITDDKGNRFCDDSMGFKGEIPELEPGECFEFTSETPISSASAVFYGSCKIQKDGQSKSEEIKIPTFYLSAEKEESSVTIN